MIMMRVREYIWLVESEWPDVRERERMANYRTPSQVLIIIIIIMTMIIINIIIMISIMIVIIVSVIIIIIILNHRIK